MCTAYELGSQRGSSPHYLEPAAVEVLLTVQEIRLIRPTLPAPVILPDGSLRTMLWGVRRSFASKVKGGKPTWRSIVNSREDKLDGRTWKASFAERRCLIPASAFYEWVEMSGRNVPLRVERPDGETLWIAGIWEEDKERGECFSMITTEPNELLVSIHDRMPAVLAEEQVPAYLGGRLHEFGPSRVPMIYTEAENFLRKKKEPPSSLQGDLF